MTEKQLKMLAELVLINDERLTVLSEIQNQIIEETSDSNDAFAGVANRLRSWIEQSSALSRDSKFARDLFRKELGL